MTASKRSKRLRLLFRVAFTIIGGFGTQAAAADKPKTVFDESTKRYARVTDPSLHVGAETGKACHVPGKQYIQNGADKTKIFTFKGVSATGSSARWKKGKR